MPQELSHDRDDDSLNDARHDKCGLIIVVLDQIGDERNECRAASAKAGRDDAGCKAAAIRKPFERRPDARTVNESRPNSGHTVIKVEFRQGTGASHQAPADSTQYSRNGKERY